MFVDYVKIKVEAGTGGNGCMSFRREKYVPNGGPDGGNGGNGGDIIFEVDEGLSTLVSLRYNSLVKAKNGTHGQGSAKDGKNGTPTIVKVPVGTIVKLANSNEIIADLVEHEQQAVIARGGSGGKGNKFFKSNRNKAPRISENGSKGEQFELIVELKLLADVGIIGLPSVGKSTFISVITNVKAKIASYPFTTINPNLGVVKVSEDSEFVIADMPGLIAGASLGKGLGHQFLKHIERTTVLCHMIDMSGGDELRDPVLDYEQINQELELYDERLLLRPQVIVANKMDLPVAIENLAKFKQTYPDLEVFEVSLITNTGIQPVLYKLAHLVAKTPRFNLSNDKVTSDTVVYKYAGSEPDFKIHITEDGVYEITGKKIEEIFERTNFDQDESVMKFANTIRKMGIEDELRKMGCRDGDLVRIKGYEFELID